MISDQLIYTVETKKNDTWVLQRLDSCHGKWPYPGPEEFFYRQLCYLFVFMQLFRPTLDCQLTAQEITDIECVLKSGLCIIWGEQCVLFEQVLKYSKLKTLHQSRDKILNKFVKKSIDHKKFQQMILQSISAQIQTRSIQARFKHVPSRTIACGRSAIPTITNLANQIKPRT